MENKPVTSMYSKTPAYIYGFHGCTKEVFDKVIYQNQPMKKRDNAYDWLGNGIYFWENSYQRAADWATQRYGEDGRVIGAFIDLGYCLDLTDYKNTEILREGYRMLKELCLNSGMELPQNKKGKSKDVLLRNLDCAVIQQIHEYNKSEGIRSYDSVRGIFLEGEPVYEGSEFMEKTHTQVSILNPNCIKGFFVPRGMDDKFVLP